MAEVRWGSLPFDEAIRFFGGKKLVPTERWSDLWHEAHDTGFMVAGAMRADLLADLQGAVGKAIEKGTTLAEFRKDFDRIVERHGWHGWTGENWEGGKAWRTMVIYDTNLRMSYSAGRWAQIQANKAAAPYLIYRHSDLSVSPRPLHKSWDGLVVAVDDPWVTSHWPPNGWGCKCRMFALSARDLKKMGKDGPDSPPDDGTFEWTDKVTGETHTVPKGIDPGFGYTPGASRPDLVRQELRRKLEALPPKIADKLKPVANQPPPAPPTVPPMTPPTQAYWDPQTPAGAWHEAAFAAAPEWVKAAVQKAGTVGLLPAERGKGGFYMRVKQAIHMGSATPAENGGKSLWRHEFGHFVDHKSGPGGYSYRSSEADFTAAMQADARALSQAAGNGLGDKARQRGAALARRYQAVEDRMMGLSAEDREALAADDLRAVGLDAEDVYRAMDSVHGRWVSLGREERAQRASHLAAAIAERDGNGLMNALGGERRSAERGEILKGSVAYLSDLIGSATNNKVAGYHFGRFGHSDSYYRSPGARQTESFANLMVLFGEGNRFWVFLAERFTPNMAELFKSILK